MNNYKTLIISGQKYSLIKIYKDFSKENSYGVGLYVLKGRKYIIRILNDVSNNQLIDQLKSEFYLLNELYEKKPKFNIPKVIGQGLSNNLYYLIREYAEGEEIKNEKIALNSVKDVITYFNSLNYNDFKFKNKNKLIRSGIFQTLGVNIYFLLNILRNPKYSYIFIHLLSIYYRNIAKNNIINEKYVFAHRDIAHENILLSKNKLTLIDFEISAFSSKETDLALTARYYSEIWSYEAIIELIKHFIKNKSDLKNFKRLTSFYILQLIMNNSDNKKEIENSLLYLEMFAKRLIPDLNKYLKDK